MCKVGLVQYIPGNMRTVRTLPRFVLACYRSVLPIFNITVSMEPVISSVLPNISEEFGQINRIKYLQIIYLQQN